MLTQVWGSGYASLLSTDQNQLDRVIVFERFYCDRHTVTPVLSISRICMAWYVMCLALDYYTLMPTLTTLSQIPFFNVSAIRLVTIPHDVHIHQSHETETIQCQECTSPENVRIANETLPKWRQCHSFLCLFILMGQDSCKCRLPQALWMHHVGLSCLLNWHTNGFWVVNAFSCWLGL